MQTVVISSRQKKQIPLSPGHKHRCGAAFVMCCAPEQNVICLPRADGGHFSPVNAKGVVMLSFHRAMRFSAAVVAAAIMMTATMSRSYAETGSVRFHIVKTGFIIGVGAGSGTLRFRGRT